MAAKRPRQQRRQPATGSDARAKARRLSALGPAAMIASGPVSIADLARIEYGHLDRDELLVELQRILAADPVRRTERKLLTATERRSPAIRAALAADDARELERLATLSVEHLSEEVLTRTLGLEAERLRRQMEQGEGGRRRQQNRRDAQAGGVAGFQAEFVKLVKSGRSSSDAIDELAKKYGYKTSWMQRMIGPRAVLRRSRGKAT